MPIPLSSPTTTLLAAVDPGKVTGLSYLVITEEAISQPNAYELTVPEFFDHFPRTFELSDRDDLDLVIVCESFQISERTIKTALSLDALDIIGWLKGEQLYKRARPFYQQTPAQAKRFSTDEKLKTLGWFERTKDGHANDANRHLLAWLMSTDWPVRDHIIAGLAQELLK